MASHVYVLDSSLKRTQVKVTPGKFLREILEEACAARKWSADQYTLKNQKDKTLDLSQPFRLSGLSNGARLQLVQASKSTGVVNVALDVPQSDSGGGGRLSDRFPSNTSVWLVLRKFEEGVAGAPTSSRRNFTERGAPSSARGNGRMMYEQPCVQVMGRSLDTFADLQKTLAQLGFNDGSVSLRMRYQVTDRPLEEAMTQISEFFKTSTDQSANGENSASQRAEGAHAAAEGTSVPTAPDTTMQDAPTDTIAGETAGPEPSSPPATSEPAPTAQPVENDVLASSSIPSESQATPATSTAPTTSNTNTSTPTLSVYRPPTSSTPLAATTPDDPTSYDPTIDQARALQASLKTQSQNKRLLSDRELSEQETARQTRLAAVQNVTIRLRYPDQCFVETSVPATETGRGLYDRVRATLARPDEPVVLRFNAGQVIPDQEGKFLVRDLGFRGKVLVTVLWGQGASEVARKEGSLKRELREQATELRVEMPKVEEGGGGEGRKEEAKASEKGSVGGSGSGKGRAELEGKLKKFMGFGKK
ncbi:hypothetical protein MBLNU230_g6025t1 [Neophaeotheca triangularis]